MRACARAARARDVGCRIVLAMGIGQAGEEGSSQRESFTACLVSDLAEAGGEWEPSVRERG